MFDEAGEDEILLAALMQLGAKGGGFGGGRAGAKGGARGAARGFKLTKKDVAEQRVQVSLGIPEAAALVRQALESTGTLVGSEERADGSVAFRALLGVGIGGLNPAVVTAIVGEEPPDTVAVSLRAVGREGLIKQHPADKALAKVATLIK